jgi:hypothetical protein
LYDYSKGEPDNPEAILGQKVEQIFPDGYLYDGTIIEYSASRKWWRIGDREEKTFRELCKMTRPPEFNVFRYSASGSASSTCTEIMGLAKESVEVIANESVWDMEGSQWRLVNVFSIGGGQILGAYCPLSDFHEAMLHQTRMTLVVSNATVEVAPLADIRSWISFSNHVAGMQLQVASGCRPRRQEMTPVSWREVKAVKKWVQPHDHCCGLCHSLSGQLEKCSGCNVAVHKNCAMEDGQNNILCLPNKLSWWVCDSCYFDAHGGGE